MRGSDKKKKNKFLYMQSVKSRMWAGADIALVISQQQFKG